MPKEIVRDIAGGFDVKVAWGRFEGDVQLAVIMTPPQTSDQPDNLVDLVKTWSEDTDPIVYDGLYCTLDRDGINRLIRTLRKARDQAMGADA